MSSIETVSTEGKEVVEALNGQLRIDECSTKRNDPEIQKVQRKNISFGESVYTTFQSFYKIREEDPSDAVKEWSEDSNTITDKIIILGTCCVKVWQML